VELRPFHPADTQALVDAAAQRGIIPSDARTIAEWLHRRSGGNPLILGRLFEELATGKYDLSSPYALRRLDLDRRIHEVFPVRDSGTDFNRRKQRGQRSPTPFSPLASSSAGPGAKLHE
jgi:hypothetical protein